MAENKNPSKHNLNFAMSKDTQINTDITNLPSTCNQPNLHIDLQIHISPDSTPEQIECIFASMAKHLYGRDDK